MTFARTQILLALLACGLALPQASAQSPGLAEQLAPCLNADTALVAKIDVTRLDVDALAAMALDAAAGSMSPEQVDDLQTVIQQESRSWQQRVTRFREAGGERLFIVVNLSDVLLAVPRTSRLDETAMTAWLDDLDDRPVAVARKGGLLVAARPRTLERRKDEPPTPRAALRSAVGKATGAPVELFLILSADSRRVLEAMLPSMLGPDVKLRDGTFVRGLRWATVGIGLAPAPSLSMYIESADATAASALRDFFVQGLTRVTQISHLKEAYPNIQASIPALTPRVSGTTLRLTLDEKQTGDLMSRFLTPGLFELHESILRERCARALSSLGRALLIYANDYEDKWPPSLETLVDVQKYDPSGLVCPAMRHRPDYNSYVYRGVDTGGMWVEPMIIVVHDRAGNHKGGRYVLFVDSHVEWVTEARFKELVKQDNELRRARGFPEKPAE